MKSSIKKIVALGCGLPTAFIILGILSVFYQTHKKLEYRETGYSKDYLWNDIEVGTVIRYPGNSSIPIGRYCAVIAFKNSQMTDARILLRGPLGEVPERPEFVSGKEQTVIYRTKSKREVTFDLSRWMTYPTRDSAAPEPDHHNSLPKQTGVTAFRGVTVNQLISKALKRGKPCNNQDHTRF